MKVIRDEDGVLRARTEAGQQLLSSFLEEDVQESVSHCQDLLTAVQDILSGAETTWEETGNAHTVTMSPDGVTIEGAFHQEGGTLQLSLDEFRKAVEAWLESIEGIGGAQ